MENQNYELIKKLESKINEKLFSYINNNTEILNTLRNLKLDYSHFLEEDNKLAFNTWFSTDFVLSDGKTVIEKFLEEDSYKLNPKEIKALKNRNKSHCSLFEIIGYREDGYVIVKDILINKEYLLFEPELYNSIEVGELVLARVSKILDSYNFIGDINHLPSFAKHDFIEDILYDFNDLRKSSPMMTISKYLKSHSLNLYSIYYDTILSFLEMTDDIEAYIYGQLGEFTSYMEGKEKDNKIREYSANLLDIFEYYLAPRHMTLTDIHLLNLNKLVSYLIDESFINSKSGLNSYISSLKHFIAFLNKKDKKYNRSYSEILEISKNRFYLMRKLKHDHVFHIDSNLLTGLMLNQVALTFLDDFEKFMLYIFDTKVELTAKNKYIRRIDLLKLNEDLENGIALSNGAKSQKSFLLINLFYHMAIGLDLAFIEDNELVVDEKMDNYSKLIDKERFVLLFQYLLSDDFVNNTLIGKPSILRSDYIEYLKGMISSMSLKEEYTFSLENKSLADIFLKYTFYLKVLGIIKIRPNDEYTISITPLGSKLFKNLNKSNENLKDSKVINLNIYKSHKQ